MLTKSLKRTGGLVAAAALVVAGASSASAASDVEYVPFESINPKADDDYLGWHQEYKSAENPAGDESIQWSEDPEGVELGFNGPAQLINGLVETDEPGKEMSTDELIELIETADFESIGNVSFQVGLYYGDDGDGGKNWTTLRPVNSSESDPANSGQWEGTGGVDAFNLENLEGALELEEGDQVFLTGFGVHAQNEAVVSSITWGDTEYQFVEEPSEEPGDGEDEDGSDEDGDDQDGADEDGADEEGDDTDSDDTETDDSDQDESDDVNNNKGGDEESAAPVVTNPAYTG